MDFQTRLKQLRESRGISQEALADKLNIPRTSITHYEKSDSSRLPRHDRIEKIAEFFVVSLDYLLTGKTDAI
ncbi:helix-turn-helix transcriptional regulator (plasmid) [Aneurinibacillus sp. Ricciae_BoGa-3]|uniref:helix-turn-helix domain-containing protein n=1 Tax=Aneurinibacillus sp. Ricciae_BoGa-3 TaxID=3022697 RepID=UPI002340AC03|nr:helix-turn-helix transcriptional regulator [Aneurinibacillus sp. Ricciae_BoGa-3]WCK57373.1 helix-turn-helix transcriptional regulator [Aneurinibacillus sp. Ricciae_BoGa-3]